MVKSYDAGKVMEGYGWIALHRNENHFIPSEWAETVLRKKRGINYTSYPDPFSRELREKLAELHGVHASNIFVGNGSDGVLGDVLSHLRHRFAELNLPQVGYKVYDMLASRLNFTVKRYDIRLKDLDGISLSGLTVIDSPNAITGSVMPADLMEELQGDPNNFAIWDNCYGDFETKSLCIPDNLSKTVIVRSFSKYYGLAGVRLGYCIASSSCVAELDRLKDIYNVNALAQFLALRALECSSEFEAFASRMLIARNTLYQYLCNLGFDVTEPHGNFIFASHPDVSASEIQTLLEARKILVRRFDYPETANWLRITVPNDADLAQVCDALQSAVGFHHRTRLSAVER